MDCAAIPQRDDDRSFLKGVNMANGYFNFPHSATYDRDLGFLIKLYLDVQEKLERYLETSTITFADPITWDITEQYTALTCVIDRDGTAYLSKQPVPVGIAISNTDYWLPIFNYDDNINQLRSQIAYNAGSMDTITADLVTGDLVFYGGDIYTVLHDLPAGSRLLVDTNIEAYTVDKKINDIRDDLNTEVNNRIAAIDAEKEDREAADTSLADSIAAETQARESAVTELAQAISDETTNRQAADASLADSIATETQARESAVTELAQAISDEAGARELLAGNVAQNASDIADIQNEISSADFGAKHYIFIGDSFAQRTPSFIDLAATYAGIPAANYTKIAVAGIGFTNPDNTNGYLTALQSYTGDRSAITDIFVIGGLNDATFNTSSGITPLENAIEAFATYAKAAFTKAKLHLGYIGNALDSSTVLYGRAIIQREWSRYVYNTVAPKHGFSPILNIEYSLSTSRWNYGNDLLHPNEAGSISIAAMLASYLLGYNVTMNYPPLTAAASGAAPYTLDATFSSATYQINNGIFTLRIPDLSTINADRNTALQGGTFTKIATFNNLYFNKPFTYKAAARFDYFDSLTYQTIDVQLYFTGDSLYLRTLDLANNAYINHTVTGTTGHVRIMGEQFITFDTFTVN